VGAVKRLLEILGKQEKIGHTAESPWAAGSGIGFVRDAEPIRALVNTLHDLSMYGPAVCNDWSHREIELLSFVYQPSPRWLVNPVPAASGCIHGDPNSTNCFVNESDPANFQLIDCGKYRPHARLVSDLALIEADIKYNLLGTERSLSVPAGRVEQIIRRLAPGLAMTKSFLDLDCRQLWSWCEVEKNSIESLLNAATSPYGASSDSATRAYELVGLVRAAARKITPADDEMGAHYFAGLLYWTIRILKLGHIRPTKRLLALFSVSEILRRFGNA
jgi:hypothetical protein